MKRVLQVGALGLLPWRSMANLLAAAACGCLVVAAIKSQIHLSPFLTLAITGTAYALTYVGLVWGFDLLNESERVAIAGWLRRRGAAAGLALDYERG